MSATASTAARHILLVEDDRALAHTLMLKMQSQGHHVVLARDGQSCLAYLAKERFDVVLLDMVLPEADGFWVLQQMARLPKRPVVFALSSLRQTEDEQRALKLGAAKYLVKSDMQLEDIVSAVEQVGAG